MIDNIPEVPPPYYEDTEIVPLNILFKDIEKKFINLYICKRKMWETPEGRDKYYKGLCNYIDKYTSPTDEEIDIIIDIESEIFIKFLYDKIKKELEEKSKNDYDFMEIKKNKIYHFYYTGKNKDIKNNYNCLLKCIDKRKSLSNSINIKNLFNKLENIIKIKLKSVYWSKKINIDNHYDICVKFVEENIYGNYNLNFYFDIRFSIIL
jgi:hypothetical protein